jgi:hypothetical protein
VVCTITILDVTLLFDRLLGVASVSGPEAERQSRQLMFDLVPEPTTVNSSDYPEAMPAVALSPPSSIAVI